MASGVEFTTAFIGYKEATEKLKQLDPELRKEMDREIRSLLRPIVSRAKTYIPTQPLSNWNYGTGRYLPSRLPFWDYTEAVKSIQIKSGAKRRRKGSQMSDVWMIQQSSASGVVFEWVGRGKSDSWFVRNMLTKWDQQPRAIWRAFNDFGGRTAVGNKVIATVDDYIKTFERDMNDIVKD